MNTDSIDKQLNTILKDFEQESTDAYTEQEVGIDFKALDEAYRVARNSIKQLIQTVEVEARLDEENRLTLELTDNKTLHECVALTVDCINKMNSVAQLKPQQELADQLKKGKGIDPKPLVVKGADFTTDELIVKKPYKTRIVEPQQEEGE